MDGGGKVRPQAEGTEPIVKTSVCAVLYVAVAEPGVGKVDAIEGGGLDVVVNAGRVEVPRDDVELLAVAQGERSIWNARGADEIDVLAGNGVDAEGLEDEPGGHGRQSRRCRECRRGSP